MAKTTTCPITQSIQNAAIQIANATGASGTGFTTSPSNTTLLLTAGSEGSVLKSLIVSSDDTSARLVTFYVSTDSGTTKYWVCSVSIPATAGQTGAIANVDILGSSLVLGLPLDQSGKPVYPMAAAARMYVGVQVAVTAGKFVNVMAVAEDY